MLILIMRITVWIGYTGDLAIYAQSREEFLTKEFIVKVNICKNSEHDRSRDFPCSKGYMNKRL